MNGRPIFSCSTRVATANGREIETIEGLSDGEKLHPVQEAFLAEGALQCGYCTPGMIMTAVALLAGKAACRRETKIRDGMQSNVCRCGTYVRIVAGGAAGGGSEWRAAMMKALESLRNG